MKTRKKTAKKIIIRFFTITEMLAVAAIVSSVPMSAYVRAKQKAAETECMNNMRQVGMAITSYHLSNGVYPKAAFYPEKPKTDENSIRVILADEINSEKVWICPSMPDKLQEKGLTWVYNDTIAGKATIDDPANTWILIEFSCVSKNAPHPHPGGFNIVYADGHVKTTKELPKDISENQQVMLKKIFSQFALKN